MLHTSSANANYAKVLWATVLACCLQACLILAEDATNSLAEDDNLQLNNDEMSKRDWNRDLSMWGKRGWNNIHGGWAVKRSIPSWVEQQTLSSIPIVQKRSWQKFQGGWGKRLAPYDEEAAIQEIASMLEQHDRHDVSSDLEDKFDVHDDEKRNWNKFTDGWGKRSKWDNFRGTWGKREPNWTNLKGMWGKRSEREQILN
uniref:Allatotropin-B n=1 Tax=Colaphellus bowringi TaxID=561076 RepID=A0A7H1K1C0_9CUCU|nr:allatotropin-B [Colaphellus bowringi]